MLMGMSLQEFEFLLAKIERMYPEEKRKRLSKRLRQRGIGAGRRFSLNLRDRVLLLLFYYRTYATQRHDPQLKIKSFSSNSYRGVFPNKQILHDYAESCAILCPSANYESSLCLHEHSQF